MWLVAFPLVTFISIWTFISITKESSVGQHWCWRKQARSLAPPFRGPTILPFSLFIILLSLDSGIMAGADFWPETQSWASHLNPWSPLTRFSSNVTSSRGLTLVQDVYSCFSNFSIPLKALCNWSHWVHSSSPGIGCTHGNKLGTEHTSLPLGSVTSFKMSLY